MNEASLVTRQEIQRSGLREEAAGSTGRKVGSGLYFATTHKAMQCHREDTALAIQIHSSAHSWVITQRSNSTVDLAIINKSYNN